MAAPLALARWLAEESREDRGALEALEQTQRSELLSTGAAREAVDCLPAEVLRISSTCLRSGNIESLVSAAEKLGLKRAPGAALGEGLSDVVTLCGPAGERMAMTRDAAGRVTRIPS